MYSIRVFEQPGGSIAYSLKKLLAGDTNCGIFTGTDIEQSYCHSSFSLGIIPPSKDRTFLHYSSGNFNTLLAPGTLFPAESSIHASRVVSYGFSPRDSITLSSMSEEKIVLTIQRELFNLNGSILERQEIPIKNIGSPMDSLVIASAFLLLGTSPESLS